MKKEDIILYARLLCNIFGTTNAMEIARQLQYEVDFVDADLHFFKAGTYKYHNGRNIIYINNKYDNMAKNILCAHELGHAILGHQDEIWESGYDANLFAVALLFNGFFNVPLGQMSNDTLQAILDQNINLLPNEEVVTGILEKKEYVETPPADKCIVDPLGNPISDINKIHIEVREVDDWKLKELNKNPTDIYQLAPRRFEEFIAEILMRKGYKVELTPATRDGGIDIQVSREDDLGSFLYFVQCKRYKPTRKVGVEVLRELYGILAMKKVTYGIVVTSSSFSQPAQEFQQGCRYQMSLKDFDSIKQWLHEVV